MIFEPLKPTGGAYRRNDCTNINCSASARWKCSILAWPAGLCCPKCKARMQKAWDAALGLAEWEGPEKPKTQAQLAHKRAGWRKDSRTYREKVAA